MNHKLGLLGITGLLLLASCGTTPTTGVAPTPAPIATTPSNPTTPGLKPSVVQGAYYLTPDGVRVTITPDMLQNAGTRFVFYAWLEDEQGGINTANVGGTSFADPGLPTASERTEVAPIQNQNLLAGYVGYKADNGQVYPVIGAGVRWDIQDRGPTTIQFSAADDGGGPGGDGLGPQYINDRAKSAWTYTNSSTGSNARFPSQPTKPFYNLTGIGTPDTNGFTWSALWSPDEVSTNAQVVAIAYINGTEVDKFVLNKTFAPSAALNITKTIDNANAGLNESRNFTITVTNTGLAAATNIQLNDVLRSGNADTYSSTAPAGTTANATDGFTAAFDLQPGESRSFVLPAQASATGVYCDVASITNFVNGDFGLVNPTAGSLQAEACLTVTAPQLNIIKTLVDAAGNPIANNQTVGANTPVFARITVTNGGNAVANNVVLRDALNTPNGSTYSIVSAPVASPAGVAITQDAPTRGFSSAPFTLAPGAAQSFTFSAAGSAPGTYCDIADFTSSNGNPNTNVSENVCFTVVTPQLTIDKFNTPVAGGRATNTLLPGDSFNSTITIANSGTGPATQVVARDLLSRMAGGTTSGVNFGSGTYTLRTGGVVNQTGMLTSDGNFATAPSLTIASGQTLTLNLVSSVPAGARAGEYCDTGSFTSSNAGTGQDIDCVNVVNFVSEQTQLTDQIDPIRQGDTTGTVLSSALIVELSSNEGARNNAITYNFGTTDPFNQVTPGVFGFDSTALYYDPTPTRDPQTGAVTSDFQSPTASLLVNGTDFTLSAAAGVGRQSVDFRDDFVIQPGGVVYVRTHVFAPAGTVARQYQQTLYWTNNAQFTGVALQNFKAESTTVIP